MGGGHVGSQCAVSMQNLILCPSQGLRGPSFYVDDFPYCYAPSFSFLKTSCPAEHRSCVVCCGFIGS